jgi:putative DNA primase/helicase
MLEMAHDPYDGLLQLTLDRASPLNSAQKFLQRHYADPRGRLLHYSRGQFWAWDGKCWEARTQEDIAAEVHRFLVGSIRVIASGGGSAATVPFEPRAEDTRKVCDSLKHEVHMPDALVMPSWNGAPTLDPRHLVICQNGILNILTRDLIPHTPLF